MDWSDNLINVNDKLPPGKCPNCGSDDTDYNYTKVMNNWGYLDVWCNTCKHAFHISRVKIEGETLNKEVPKNLIY